MRRVKVKKTKMSMGGKDITSMFNKMLGAEDADPSIVCPKYVIVKAKFIKLSKILNASVNDVFRKAFPTESDGCDEILEFAKELSEIEFVSDDAADEKKCAHYVVMKEHNITKRVILTCRGLIPYKKFLEAPEFDDSFIARIPGMSFSPLPFSNFDIKMAWASDTITVEIKRYVFAVLKSILKICTKIYRIVTSPDVDVKEFSNIIISSISNLKKMVPRCEKAFAKIERSAALMENNFDGYYKDFVQSQNPSTILEGFVVDCSKDGDTDLQTARQFKQIINYYRKATAGKITDPKAKKLFDTLGANFDAMEASQPDVLSEEPDAKTSKKTKTQIKNAKNRRKVKERKLRDRAAANGGSPPEEPDASGE
jgi:hypothetical protein